jgi:hypothetical protein
LNHIQTNGGGTMKSFGKLGYLFTLLMFLVINGCGGGSSDSNGTLSVAVTAPSGSVLTGTAIAAYSNPQGKDPSGLEIDFSTDRPDIVALDSTKASANSSGQAQITFRTITPASNTTVKIIASTGGLSSFQQFTVTGTTSGSGTTAPPPPPPGVVIDPQSISFVSASPASITLKGTGGAGHVETSIISFLVKGTNGLALSGQTVDFVLSTTVGGLSITPSSAVSDSTGIVKTIVNAGVISTPVRVFATVRGTVITTQSDQLTVTTGIPDQDSFSLSAGTLNSESFNHDGITVPITVIMSDHFNNPVPDGTAVNFTTNVGQIVGSSTTANGSATVNWTSSDPRVYLPSPKAGRFIIMAYAIGEESFTDLNGNGLADAGEFTDTTEAFRDDNFNGVRDSNEPFIDFNGDGIFSTGDGLYNGVLQGAAYVGAPRSKHVFKNIELVMSTDASRITTNPASLTGPGSLDILIQDLNGNTMAAGTKVDVTSPGFGTLSGATSYTVPQNTGFGQTITVNLAAGTTPAAHTGLMTITVTSVNGLKTILTVPVSGIF